MIAHATVHARATFERSYPPPPSATSRGAKPDDAAHGLGESVDRQREVRQGIRAVPVDAELGDHDVRAEGAEHGRDDRVERVEVHRVVGVRIERQVHRVAAPRALAQLLDGAGPGEQAVARARAWRS